MSMEQAIFELAAAIRHLADSNREIASASAPLITVRGSAANVEATSKDAELETAVAKVETDAAAAQKEAMALAEADRKAAAKAGAQAALDKAAAEKAKPADDDLLGAEVELDWAKDVRPVLLQVGKDRPALVALMAKYGVPAGGSLEADKRPALLAEANAILAARG